MRKALIVFALMMATGGANAAMISTGTISGVAGDSATVSLPIYDTPGAYRAYIAFSQPGSFTLAYNVVRSTNLFCDFHDGSGYVPCGGDDVPVGFDLFAGPGAKTATLSYALSAPFRETYAPDQYGEVSDRAVDAGFEFFFEEDGTVSYRVVTTPVPEPASWALMILGFAASGIAMRRRKPALA